MSKKNEFVELGENPNDMHMTLSDFDWLAKFLTSKQDMESEDVRLDVTKMKNPLTHEEFWRVDIYRL